MLTTIDRIGMEIEGEFSEDFKLALDLSGLGDVGTDGSLSTCESNRTPHTHRDLRLYEFRTYPIPFRTIRKTSKKMFDLFEKYAKREQFHWNKTAGFHIHFSFKPRQCPEIWSVQFSREFHKSLKEQFPVVMATRKGNHFCKAVISEQDIAFGTTRYRSINYNAAFNKLGTIEFRIFPSDHPIAMHDYLLFTIKTIQDFIKNGDKKLRSRFIVKLEEPENRTENFTETIQSKMKEASMSETARSNFEDILTSDLEGEDLNPYIRERDRLRRRYEEARAAHSEMVRRGNTGGSAFRATSREAEQLRRRVEEMDRTRRNSPT